MAELLAGFLKPILRFLFGSAADDARLAGLVFVFVGVVLGAATRGLVRRRGWRSSDLFAAIVSLILANLGMAMLIL